MFARDPAEKQTRPCVEFCLVANVWKLEIRLLLMHKSQGRGLWRCILNAKLDLAKTQLPKAQTAELSPASYAKRINESRKVIGAEGGSV